MDHLKWHFQQPENSPGHLQEGPAATCSTTTTCSPSLEAPFHFLAVAGSLIPSAGIPSSSSCRAHLALRDARNRHTPSPHPRTSPTPRTSPQNGLPRSTSLPWLPRDPHPLSCCSFKFLLTAPRNLGEREVRAMRQGTFYLFSLSSRLIIFTLTNITRERKRRFGGYGC